MAEYLVKDIEKNIQKLNTILSIDKSFDLMYRTIQIGNRKSCIYFIDGFVKDEILQRLLEYFLGLKERDLGKDIHEMSKGAVPYGEVDLRDNIDDIVKDLLSGIPILVVDGFDRALALDCRTYPARSVDEPVKDKVMRGSRDGFVETLVFNTALIRRRIRDPRLVMEMCMVGRTSKTDVVISYVEGRVDEKVLKEIKYRIDSIDIDALTMNHESLAECLYQHKWYNPFPKFKFTERPDAATAAILEGNIVILVDNSPAAMIIPTSVFDIIEDADDYYFPPITGTYLRLSRFVINIFAILMTPTFLLLTMNPEWIPKSFEFIKITDVINIPIIFQLLILEFCIDGLRLAAMNTPTMLSTPLSVVAAIVFGDYTVSSGWFNSEIMLYMAFVAVSNYTQSSFELGYALKFMRIILLILTSLFSVYGYIAGILFTIIAIISNRTISGRSYIYPLIPFNGKQLLKRFFRISLPSSERKSN